MDSYKFTAATPIVPGAPSPLGLQRLSDGAWIAFSQDSEACAKFIADAKAGATVTDANGHAWAYSDAAVAALIP